jgi:hypothetical protein
VVGVMEAEKKLRGAEYHLRRMEKFYLKNEERFIYELEAFLVKARSVPDVLLEDFNKKYSLGISLEERLEPQIFEQKAKQQKNEKAIAFVEWWKSKKEELPLRLFFSKRNMSVHRKQVTPDLKKVNLFEVSIAVCEEVTVEKYDEQGNLIEISKSSNAPPKVPEPKPAKIEWCFKDYPEESVLEVSRKLLNNIRTLVEEAKTRFLKEK